MSSVALLVLAIAHRLVVWPRARLDPGKDALLASDWRLILLGALCVLAGYLWRAFRGAPSRTPDKGHLREIWKISVLFGYAAVLTLGRAGESCGLWSYRCATGASVPAASFAPS